MYFRTLILAYTDA